MAENLWLPNPPDKTMICLGFDGSDSDDFTAIQAETIDGLTFTPRYGPDKRPTIWDPAQFGGTIPRGEVAAAVDEIFERYDVKRMYCDPKDWYSEIGDWALKYGDEHVFEWDTGKANAMFAELERFRLDLQNGRITHDGCPIASAHIANAIKVSTPGQKYLIRKPYGAYHQKIDAAMARILAHTAATNSRDKGWTPSVRPSMFRFS